MTGSQFEVRIDGAPRTYRDRKDYAMEAARLLKSKQPHSMVEVKGLQSGDVCVWLSGQGERWPQAPPVPGSTSTGLIKPCSAVARRSVVCRAPELAAEAPPPPKVPMRCRDVR